MPTLKELKDKLSSLQVKKVQFETRLTELTNREAEQRKKLLDMGVTDVVSSLTAFTQEAQTLKSSIESSLSTL